MPKLTMTSFLGYLNPSIYGQQTDDFTDRHGISFNLSWALASVKSLRRGI